MIFFPLCLFYPIMISLTFCWGSFLEADFNREHHETVSLQAFYLLPHKDTKLGKLNIKNSVISHFNRGLHNFLDTFC